MTTIDDLKKDNIFTESNNIRLRKLTGEDRSAFFRVLKAISSMPALYELDRVNELIWKEILSSDTVLAFAVEKKEQAVYVGNCMVKHPEAGILELGIDIAPEYQNQGIATEAMRLLVGKIRLLCPDQRLISRMYSASLPPLALSPKLWVEGVSITSLILPRDISALEIEIIRFASLISSTRICDI
jgi:hypothetical protein